MISVWSRFFSTQTSAPTLTQRQSQVALTQPLSTLRIYGLDSRLQTALAFEKGKLTHHPHCDSKTKQCCAIYSRGSIFVSWSSLLSSKEAVIYCPVYSGQFVYSGCRGWRHTSASKPALRDNTFHFTCQKWAQSPCLCAFRWLALTRVDKQNVLTSVKRGNVQFYPIYTILQPPLSESRTVFYHGYNKKTHRHQCQMIVCLWPAYAFLKEAVNT